MKIYVISLASEEMYGLIGAFRNEQRAMELFEKDVESAKEDGYVEVPTDQHVSSSTIKRVKLVCNEEDMFDEEMPYLIYDLSYTYLE